MSTKIYIDPSASAHIQLADDQPFQFVPTLGEAVMFVQTLDLASRAKVKIVTGRGRTFDHRHFDRIYCLPSPP